MKDSISSYPENNLYKTEDTQQQSCRSSKLNSVKKKQ